MKNDILVYSKNPDFFSTIYPTLGLDTLTGEKIQFSEYTKFSTFFREMRTLPDIMLVDKLSISFPEMGDIIQIVYPYIDDVLTAVLYSEEDGKNIFPCFDELKRKHKNFSVIGTIEPWKLGSMLGGDSAHARILLVQILEGIIKNKTGT